MNQSAFCGMGMSVVLVPPYTAYGAAIGVNLNQVMGMDTTPGPYTPSGSGITYAISVDNSGGNSLLEAPRLMIGDGTNQYCTQLTALSGTVPWTDFNTLCYDDPPDGEYLTGPLEDATHIEFEVAAAGAAQTWSFCITALSFAP